MTRRKRETSDEEKALFRETFREVRPHLSPPAKKSAEKDEKKNDEPKLSPRARPVQSGVDGRTSERLRRGQLEPESRLDLHGMTEAAAHRALAGFLRSAHAQGLTPRSGRNREGSDSRPTTSHSISNCMRARAACSKRWCRAG